MAQQVMPVATSSDSDIVALPPHVPVVWMLGKVQSGKTSIVRVLTGATDLEIGTGFKAATRTTRVLDFPAAAPLIRFMDTRGLGEPGYDPALDIAACEQQAHLLLLVMKAMDQQQSVVLDVARLVRSRRPEWPIVVAQTALHEGYATGAKHLEPYPFDQQDASAWRAAGAPEDLVRSILSQRAQIEAIGGRGAITYVPLDFTLPEDGFEPADYGLPALMAALRSAAPASLVAALRETVGASNAALAASFNTRLLSYATAAAAADLVPVAGLAAVPGIQAKMLHSLAAVFGSPWDTRTMTRFAGCLGTGTVVRLLSTFGIRELVKLVPWYGQTAGAAAAAAASFATTYAVGKAAIYFLGQRRLGDMAPEGVNQVYAEALKQALTLAGERAPKPAAGATS